MWKFLGHASQVEVVYPSSPFFGGSWKFANLWGTKLVAVAPGQGWPLMTTPMGQFKWCFQHRLTQFCQKKLGVRLVNHDDDGWVKLATEISHGQWLPSWSPSVFFSKHLQLTPAFSQLTPFLYPSWFFTKYADGSSYLWNYHINGGVYSHPAIPAIYLFGISTVPFEYIRVPCPITMSTGITVIDMKIAPLIVPL